MWKILSLTYTDMSGRRVTVRQGIDVDKSPELPATIDFMKRCLRECDSDHSACQLASSGAIPSPTDTALPTRVIEVCKHKTTDIRLVDGLGRRGRYVALSHRWVSGPMPQWVTRQATFVQRHSWFPARSMPLCSDLRIFVYP